MAANLLEQHWQYCCDVLPILFPSEQLPGLKPTDVPHAQDVMRRYVPVTAELLQAERMLLGNVALCSPPWGRLALHAHVSSELRI